jgi:hypothetical protein
MTFIAPGPHGRHFMRTICGPMRTASGPRTRSGGRCGPAHPKNSTSAWRRLRARSQPGTCGSSCPDRGSRHPAAGARFAAAETPPLNHERKDSWGEPGRSARTSHHVVNALCSPSISQRSSGSDEESQVVLPHPRGVPEAVALKRVFSNPRWALGGVHPSSSGQSLRPRLEPRQTRKRSQATSQAT